MQQIELIAPDGARLHVSDSGSPHRPVALLCLPVGVEAFALDALIAALSGQFRVLVSQSRWVQDDGVIELEAHHNVSLGAHAADVVQIIDDLQLHDVHLIGYCSGALIALAAADKLGARVRSLTFCNGAYVLREQGSDYESDVLELAQRYAPRPGLAKVIYPTVKASIRDRVGTEGRADEDRSSLLTQFRDETTFIKYIKAIRGIFLSDELSRIGHTDIPVLAVSGGCDGMTPASQFDEVRHLLTNAVHHVLDGEDHYMPCRPQSEAMGLIRGFLQQHVAADADETRRSVKAAGGGNRDGVLVLTQQALAQLVNEVGLDTLMDDTIARLEVALLRYDEALVDLRVRDGFHYDRPTVGLIEWMPILSKNRDVVIKLVGYHPTNIQRRLATVQASILRLETSSGRLNALLEGSFATALRTGAASAIATRLCANPGHHVVGMVGCGAQSVTQLHALSRVMRIDEVLYYDIDPAAVETFEQRVEFIGLRCRAAPLAELEAASDVLCTATSVGVGMGPVIQGHRLKPHVHINAVGADFPGKTELPVALLKRALVIADFPAQAHLEGECQQLDFAEIGPALHQVVKDPTRVAAHRASATVLDSTGFALEDEAVMEVLIDHARALGVGLRLDLNASEIDPRDPYALQGVDRRASPINAVA
jgi:ornithine cyclodeaminase/alanine dehydrogenase-like protein (mu-crystallin family)/pimeloyl-ACP methyl ester carboxylesterase